MCGLVNLQRTIGKGTTLSFGVSPAGEPSVMPTSAAFRTTFDDDDEGEGLLDSNIPVFIALEWCCWEKWETRCAGSFIPTVTVTAAC